MATSNADEAKIEPNGHFSLPRRITSGKKKCAHCKKPGAKFCCADCRAGELGDIRTHYCDATCQKAHWPKHRMSCRERRRLFRAVRIVSQLAELFASTTYTKPMQYKSHDEVGNIYVTHDSSYIDPDAWTGGHIFRQFDEEVVPDDVNEGIRAAILHHGFSQESVVQTCGFIDVLISPICQRIQEARFEIGKRAVVIRHFEKGDPPDATPKTPNLTPHSVFKIDLLTGGSFAIDLAGRQYGWQETVYKWRHIKHRAVKGSEIEMWHFGEHAKLESVTLRNYRTWETLRAAAELHTDLTQDMCRDVFDFLLVHTRNVRLFLAQEDEAFEAQKELLLDDVKVKLNSRLIALDDAGIGRMYYFPGKDGGRTRVIRKVGTQKKLEPIWYTMEEYKALEGDTETLSTEWIRRRKELVAAMAKLKKPAPEAKKIPAQEQIPIYEPQDKRHARPAHSKQKMPVCPSKAPPSTTAQPSAPSVAPSLESVLKHHGLVEQTAEGYALNYPLNTQPPPGQLLANNPRPQQPKQ